MSHYEDRGKGARVTENYFFRRAGVWHIGIGRDTCEIADQAGLSYIRTLLRYPPDSHPDRRLGSVELIHLTDGRNPKLEDEGLCAHETFQGSRDVRVAFYDESKEDDGDITDDGGSSKRRGYGYGWGPEPKISTDGARKLKNHRRLLLQRADRVNGQEAERLRDEAEQIKRFLNETTFFGRPKLVPTEEDRAYDTIYSGIKAAIKSMSEQSKVIADHFDTTIERRTTRWGYIGGLQWHMEPVKLPALPSEGDSEGKGQLEKLPDRECRITYDGVTCVVPDGAGMACIAALLRLSQRPVPAASLRDAQHGLKAETTRARLARVLRELVTPDVRALLDTDSWLDGDPDANPEQDVAPALHSGTVGPVYLGPWGGPRLQMIPGRASPEVVTEVEQTKNKYLGLVAWIKSAHKKSAIRSTIPRCGEGGQSQKARATVSAVRARQQALQADDDKARSSVSHNISTAIKAIDARSPRLADYLRENIACGRECVYRGLIEWDVTY